MTAVLKMVGLIEEVTFERRFEEIKDFSMEITTGKAFLAERTASTRGSMADRVSKQRKAGYGKGSRLGPHLIRSPRL